jgi:hypothetical protein
LPPKVQKAIEKAFEKLKNYQPSQSCQANVIDKLPDDFNYADFQNYLRQGADFYDATKSSVPMNGAIYSGQAGVAYANSGSPQTVSAVFQARPGTNAMTSMAAPRLTVYMRTSAVSMKNGGDNLRNHSFLFHEALHGQGHGDPDYDDDGLKKAFNINPKAPSIAITNHIAGNCK